MGYQQEIDFIIDKYLEGYLNAERAVELLKETHERYRYAR